MNWEMFCCVWCRTHMQDMQEVTHEVHYENYRHQKLASGSSNEKSATSTPRQTKLCYFIAYYTNSDWHRGQ